MYESIIILAKDNIDFLYSVKWKLSSQGVWAYCIIKLSCWCTVAAATKIYNISDFLKSNFSIVLRICIKCDREAGTMHTWSCDLGKGQKGIQQTTDLFMSAMHVTWNVYCFIHTTEICCQKCHGWATELFLSWYPDILRLNVLTSPLIYWYGIKQSLKINHFAHNYTIWFFLHVL